MSRFTSSSFIADTSFTASFYLFRNVRCSLKGGSVR